MIAIITLLSVNNFVYVIQICVWCWHHIVDMAEKDQIEGRCPACRTPYDKEKIVGMTVNCDRFVITFNFSLGQSFSVSFADGFSL